MKTINFYNENGNVSSSVRSQVKAQVLTKALEILADGFGTGAVLNATGGISVPVATNERGEVIYARFDLAITTQNPDHIAPKAKAKAEPKEPVVLVDLFGEDD